MSVLDELVAGAREDQRAREADVSLEELKGKVARLQRVPLDAHLWLKKTGEIPVIAEIKRASPSKGHLNDIPDPGALASQYEAGGASAISVLTEGRRFLGSFEDLDAVRKAVSIPVLNKDFIVTDYQVYEARLHGADLILLIVAALSDEKLVSLLNLARSLGLTALVETHSKEEIDRAIRAGADVIGINARNLKNLRVDTAKYRELADDLPDDVIRVAESGIFGSVEVEDYARAGADAVLVGEGVATADDHELAVKRIVEAGKRVKASDRMPLSTHEGPYFGEYGGRFVPEALVGALDELDRVYKEARQDPEFEKELRRLSNEYVGRPSPLTEAPRFAQKVSATVGGNVRVFLKREDLNHTGAHKINNALGQALLVKRMGKTRVIAETGAGQHGVATATVCALLGLKCRIYMGQIDARRQALNVARMRLLGAEVVEVTQGSRILKDAVNEALRDWVTNVDNTHYLLGTATGPHPFPTIVRDFQKVIGEEAKEQLISKGIDHPDAVVACVGGGSNAIGVMNAFLDDDRVNLYGYEAGGHGIESGEHASRFAPGAAHIGVFQGTRSYLLEDSEGQTEETYSISAGLDYASVGPEHAWLKDMGRVKYDYATDDEAMSAFKDLCETEGIIPAIESAHAVAGAYKAAADLVNNKGITNPVLIVNVSGRGDKDVATAGRWFGYLTDEQSAALDANGAHGNSTSEQE